MTSQALVTANSWNANQLRFIDWLATPPEARCPATQEQLAAELKVHAITLTKWKKIAGFADEVYDRAREAIKSDDLIDVLRAQVKLGKSGEPFASTQAADFVFKVTGMMPKPEKGGDTNIIADKVMIVRGTPELGI